MVSEKDILFTFVADWSKAHVYGLSASHHLRGSILTRTDPGVTKFVGSVAKGW